MGITGVQSIGFPSPRPRDSSGQITPEDWSELHQLLNEARAML